jgi:quercetin dioxygenase-like cupin family protein
VKKLNLTLAFVLPFTLVIGCGGGDATTPPPAAPATPAAPSAATVPTAAPSAPESPAPVASAAPAPKGPAPDPLEVGPTIYKKVFEDDNVRVLEVAFKPGDKIALHRHPDHVAYVTSAGKLKIGVAGGSPQEMDLKVGQAVFIPAQEHSAENSGTTDVKAAVVELKKASGTAAPKGADPVTVGPTIYKKVFENDRVRVLEVTFKPGAKIAAHAHPDHVAYVLTAGKLHIAPEKGNAMDADLQPGQAMFLPAQTHAANNASKSEIKAVVFELKAQGASSATPAK